MFPALLNKKSSSKIWRKMDAWTKNVIYVRRHSKNRWVFWKQQENPTNPKWENTGQEHLSKIGIQKRLCAEYRCQREDKPGLQVLSQMSFTDERGRPCLLEQELQWREQEQGRTFHMQEENFNVSREGSISEAPTERIRGTIMWLTLAAIRKINSSQEVKGMKSNFLQICAFCALSILSHLLWWKSSQI